MAVSAAGMGGCPILLLMFGGAGTAAFMFSLPWQSSAIRSKHVHVPCCDCTTCYSAQLQCAQQVVHLAGNVTAISSKAVAAKAAAASAAEDLQDDTDETAAMSQSVDVAAQLQHAQQLAQQQAADFKQNHEGSNTRLDASSTSASAAASLGLSTGSSSAADPTALTADASTMDPAEKLQMAQQHQQQQAAAFKQNNEGTAIKLDTASNAAAAAGGAAGKMESSSKDSGGSSSDASKKESSVAAGGMTDASDELGNEEATESTSVDEVGQVSDTTDATICLMRLLS